MSLCDSQIINALNMPTTLLVDPTHQNNSSTAWERSVLSKNLTEASRAYLNYMACENNSGLQKKFINTINGTETQYFIKKYDLNRVTANERYGDISSVYEKEADDGSKQLVVNARSYEADPKYYSNIYHSYSFNSSGKPVGINSLFDNSSIRMEYGDNYFIGAIDYNMDGKGQNYDYACVYEFNNENQLTKTTEQKNDEKYTSSYKYNNGKLAGQVFDVDTKDNDYTTYVKYDNLGRIETAYIDNHANDEVADSPVLSFIYSLFGGKKDEVVTYSYDEPGETVTHNDKIFTKEETEALNTLFS